MPDQPFTIRIIFAGGVILVIMMFGLGALVLQDSFYFSSLHAEMTIETFIYTFQFSRFQGESWAASLFSLRDVYAQRGSVFSWPSEEKAEAIPVLLYHGVLEHPDGTNIVKEDFLEHMFALKKAGYETVRLEDFYEFMKGEKDLPAKSFLLTFDDGRRDSYYPVDPILKVLDYSAVQFVISGRSLNEEDGHVFFHLDEEELMRMTSSGRWDIQSHSRNGHDLYDVDANSTKVHYLANKLWIRDKGRLETGKEFETRIARDLLEAKMDLETALGKEIIGFAYPFGDYGQESLNFPQAELLVTDIAKSIYPLSFYQAWESDPNKLNYPDSRENSFFAKRIKVGADWAAQDLLSAMKVVE